MREQSVPTQTPRIQDDGGHPSGAARQTRKDIFPPPLQTLDGPKELLQSDGHYSDLDGRDHALEQDQHGKNVDQNSQRMHVGSLDGIGHVSTHHPQLLRV